MNDTIHSDPKHLSEETLHTYLDGALDPAGVARVEAHLACCETCRAEKAAWQSLFVALDDLAPAAAPDLAPGVVARLRPAAAKIDPRTTWLTPVLQGAIALALIAWSGVWLARIWPTVDTLPWLDRATAAWMRTVAWSTAQVTAITTWPGALWSALREGSLSGSWRPSPPWLAGLGGALILFWLLGNVMILYRAPSNGHASS